MLKRLLVLFFALFSLFIALPINSYAQESSFTLDPELQDINDYLTTVSVTFQGELIDSSAIKKESLYICMEQDLCINDKDLRNGIFEGNLEYIGQATRGLTKDKVDAKTLQRYKFDPNDKTKTIIVCGAGNSRLKTPDRFRNGNGSEECAGDKNGENNDKDYFHSGSVYLLSLYQKLDGDIFILHTVAGFYVNHGTPEMTVSPKNNLLPDGKFTVAVSSPEIRNNGDGGKKRRNNYQIIIDGPGMVDDVINQDRDTIEEGNNQKCISFSNPGEQVSEEFPLGSGVTLSGNYVIKLKEQVDEDVPLDKCQGGFVYAEIHCLVGIPGSDPSLNVCGDPIIDPEGRDLNSMAKLFVELGLSSGGTRLPCWDDAPDPVSGLPGRTYSVTNPTDCEKLETALGTIGLNLDEFILSIFTYILSIAGAAALGLIIYGGYNYMVSRGDPEKIKHAREIITAAIIGLLFIIFSFVILQVIAGDILRIPGFNEPDINTKTGIDRIDDGSIPRTELPFP